MSADDDQGRHQPAVTPPRWQKRPTRDEIQQRRRQRRSEVAARQPNRIELRLGSDGEFVRPGDDPAVWDARRLFLDAIERVEPQVLRDLAGAPFAAFYPDFIRLAGQETQLVYLMYLARPTSWLLPDNAEGSPPRAFGEPVPRPAFLGDGSTDRLGVLNQWAARWHLEDWWCVFVATRTVLDWCGRQFELDLERLRPELERDPDRGRLPHDSFTWSPRCSVDPLNWSHFDSIGPLALSGEETGIAVPGFAWDPQLESRAEAENRLARDLRRIVVEELDRIERAAARAGLARPPRKDSGDVHFWWLARWQVRGESYPTIAKDPGIEVSGDLKPEAIRRAVTAAAALIELTRRPSMPGGRPRKRPVPRIIKVTSR